MLNGLLTLRGAWDKLRTDPVIKFLAVAVTFYGMSTFEGPLLSIKSVSALGHYTDWIIGHAHGGALGWNAFMTFGMLYWLVPRLWNTQLWSRKLAETHFWLSTVGILLYIVAMWIGGISQGLFWRALDADGFLRYPDFIEGLVASRFMYGMRLVGGLIFFGSYVLLIVNLWATIRSGSRATSSVKVVARPATAPVGNWRLLTGSPVIYSLVLLVIAVLLGISGVVTSALALAMLVIVVIAAVLSFGMEKGKTAGWHKLIEGNSLVFTILVVVAILIGGLVEIIPTIIISNKVPVTATADPVTAVDIAEAAPAVGDTTAAATTDTTNLALAPEASAPAQPTVISPYTQQPYSPLELEGRDVYVREGCYVCHSQMIRPFRHETLRYGDYSRLEESIYDHPFQWGSKRTGPDLARVGGKYANLWHYLHMIDPRSTSPGSNMPGYPWLKDRQVNLARTAHKMQTLAKLGVPYTDADFLIAQQDALSQGELISSDLAVQDVQLAPDSELSALIAYIQRLGRGPQPISPEPVAVSRAASRTPVVEPVDAGAPGGQ
jgi:cytochrome c oxidase cbb3-type subunit I/II